MKVIILAGGFGKRLWPLTKNIPKALLPVAGKPIIEHILEKIEKIEKIDKIYISSNKKFENQLKNWLKSFKSKKNIRLIIEKAASEKEKFGSIGAWNFLINKENINDDVLSISGDNLFKFNLINFVNFYENKGAIVTGLYDVKKTEEARKFGVVDIDKNNKITDFKEKPKSPKSTLVSTGIYLYPREVLKLISVYLTEGNNADTPGHFLEWLHKRKDIYGFVFREKWFDIGSPESYKEAKMCYAK